MSMNRCPGSCSANSFGPARWGRLFRVTNPECKKPAFRIFQVIVTSMDMKCCHVHRYVTSVRMLPAVQICVAISCTSLTVAKSQSSAEAWMQMRKGLRMSSILRMRSGPAEKVMEGGPDLSKPRFFLLTASKDHLDNGKQMSYIQQKHANRIEKIRAGDFVVLYAGKAEYGTNKPYQKIVSVCQAIDDQYTKLPKTDGSGFYFRKNMTYLPFEEKEIRTLIPKLSFVTNKTRWGFYFMSGFKEISQSDFDKIFM